MKDLLHDVWTSPKEQFVWLVQVALENFLPFLIYLLITLLVFRWLWKKAGAIGKSK